MEAGSTGLFHQAYTGKHGQREEWYEHFSKLIGKEYKSSKKTGKMYVW